MWRIEFLVVVLLIVLSLLLTAFAAEEILNPQCRATERSWTGAGEPGQTENKADGFPFLRNDLPPPDKMFASLQRTLESPPTVDSSSRKGKKSAHPKSLTSVVVRSWPKDAYSTDAISSHFTEDVRMKCRFGIVGKRKPSAIEVWESPKSSALVREKARELGRRRGVSLSETELLREALYQETRWCNFYNPAFCLWLYNTLAKKLKDAGLITSPKRVRILDPSSGWGDRLIAACALGAEAYHGFDPNEELQSGYNCIIRQFAPEPRSAYQVHDLPFEGKEAEVFVQPSYHIVHTSPPFFDVEDYPGKGGKAAKDHPKYSGWLESFYKPYLRQAWRGVIPGGCLAIYIEDVHVPLLKNTQEIVEGLGGKRGEVYGFRQDFAWPESGFKSSKGKVRTAAVWWKPKSREGISPPKSGLVAKKAASRNLVVDTLNLTHRLLKAGQIVRCKECPPEGLSACLIAQAIEYSAKKLKGRFDGKIAFVLKDRDGVSKNALSEKAINDPCDRDYAEVAKTAGAEIHRALKSTGPVPDWQSKGSAAPNHQKLGRDDFYLGFLAWRLQCPALTGDHMRDFQQLKSEVAPFRVQVINQWGETATDYVNPGAAEYAKMKAPLRISFADHGL